MKKGILLVFMAFILISVVSATTQEINYTNNLQNVPDQPTFVVQSLKYEPYPVNAGNWFDLWIKVQNIGQKDAANVETAFVPNYPFSISDSPTLDFGSVPGTINAYKVSTSNDASQIIFKYRVKVADNAPEGSSDLKIKITPDKSDSTIPALTYTLPIVIGKTKADFDLTMQDITPQGSSFVITNTADNPAHSVILTIKSDNIYNLGSRSVVIGDLDKGDFTIAHIKSIPQSNATSLDLEVSYTDNSGTRSTIEKTISVETPTKIDQICINNSGNYVKWIWGVVGLFLGVLLAFALISIDKKIMGRNNEKGTTSHSTTRKN